MNKGLTLKLLGIMALSVMVIACAPKKSAAELAMEAKIAEMEKQLAALNGTEAAELQTELETAKAGLRTERGNRDRQGGRRNQAETQTAVDGTAAVQAEAERRAEAGEPQLTNSEKEALLFAPQPAQSQTAGSTAAAQTTTGEFQMDGIMLVKYTGSSKSVTIPNGVEWIAQGVFENKQLTSVTIPNSVTTILKGAFRNCQLTNVTIPNGVLVINGFQENRLTSVTIPNSVTDLGGFQGNQLTSVTIPNSVVEIYESAFGYNKLTSIIIPNSVRKIGSYAFSNNQLTSVTIPASVPGIGLGTFMNNPLQSVTFERGNIDITWGRVFPTEEVYTFGDSSTYSLERAYKQGGAGTYTRNGNTWTKQ